MKGIILAAGRGTRLYPMTKTVCKPLLPVYDKPMIYYSVTVLLQAGMEEILIIVPPGEILSFSALLGQGERLGIRISYQEQSVPRGIADALLLGESFLKGEEVCLILGDNLFYGENLEKQLAAARENLTGGAVFGYPVADPRPFGVVTFDAEGNAVSIEEKPTHPKSNYIIPGLYFYDADVIEIAKGLQPSARGELEITDVNQEYLRRNRLRVIPLEPSTLWLDAGSADSLLEAAQKIAYLQKNTGKLIGCPEEAARNRGFLTEKQLAETAESMAMTAYGQYLRRLAETVSEEKGR